MSDPVMKEAMFGKGGRPIPDNLPATPAVPRLGVALFVYGERVPLSTSAAMALVEGSRKAARETNEKTGRKGIPMEVRHWRD